MPSEPMSKQRRVLILGGTFEARELAQILVEQNFDVTSSLAGVTSEPVLPPGKIHKGGFGGAKGLAQFIREQAFSVMIDVTHPFAAVISANAALAAAETDCLLLRYEREAWTPVSGDHWLPAKEIAEAAELLPQNARVFVTTGRKNLKPFLARSDLQGVVRMVEPPDFEIPPGWSCILDRPPQTLVSELGLMRRHAISHLITKNAGGPRTRAKLDAAQQLGIQVVMIARPPKPKCRTFTSLEALIEELGTLLRIG